MALPVRSDYSIAGNGPTVFLTHGVGARRQVWEGIVEKLAPHFHCITYDLRGHGGSAGADESFGIDEFVTDLEALRAQLDVEHAHFIGHSLGGMIVPAYARAYPERVKSLGLICTAAFRSPEATANLANFVKKIDTEGMPGVLDTLLGRWFTDQFRRDRPDVVDARKDQMLKANPRVYRETYRVFATTEMAPWLSEIKAPTLVMTGELDPGCGPELNEKIAAALPHSELVILPALKHSVLVEAPGPVGDALLRFLLNAR
ncbi:MAG TPA: alpha/beta fold hydrolase [Reyranella sp.]|jgi:pimeloyl-ACP methyl ester carboxylesterase|nr:alpha/beta fold hydrolase [Reyranella sp.]